MFVTRGGKTRKARLPPDKHAAVVRVEGEQGIRMVLNGALAEALLGISIL